MGTGAGVLVKTLRGGPWGRPKQAIVHVPAGMHASERGCEQSGPTLQRASLSCPSPAHPVPTQWVFRHPLTQNKLNGRPSHQEFRQGTVGGARERTSSPPQQSAGGAGPPAGQRVGPPAQSHPNRLHLEHAQRGRAQAEVEIDAGGGVPKDQVCVQQKCPEVYKPLSCPELLSTSLLTRNTTAINGQVVAILEGRDAPLRLETGSSVD